MARAQKIQALMSRLKHRRQPQSVAALADALSCTERNVKDIIRQLRDDHLIPINYDRQANGYYLDKTYGDSFELNEAWFSSAELHALMTSHHLLSNIQPGWLDAYIGPLKDRLEKLLHNASHDFAQLQQRVRILQIAARSTNLDDFKKITDALLKRQRLYVVYHGRAKDHTGDREISPQRLVYYRNNWYLDAWCHHSDGLRTFSVDRLFPARLLPFDAIDVPESALKSHYGAAYGIFAGKPNKIARLRFTAEAAKWVADEQWHSREQGRVLRDGRYELRIPYSDPRELMMDILKYGPEVEVLGPASLRKEAARRVRQMQAIYGEDA